MTFDEQDSLIESLNAAYDKAGTITDEDIKELFAKKNVIADEKAQLLLNLIDSADGSVDDSEDAMLEEFVVLIAQNDIRTAV